MSYLVHTLHMIADEIAVPFPLQANHYFNSLTKTSTKHDKQLEIACHFAGFFVAVLGFLFGGVNDKE